MNFGKKNNICNEIIESKLLKT